MILVLGSGESGVGSALLAKSKGLSVFVSDSSLIEKNYKELLLKNDIQFEENGVQVFQKLLQSSSNLITSKFRLFQKLNLQVNLQTLLLLE